MSTKSQNSLYHEMSQHVQSWKQQKASRKLYCEQNGLNIGKFNYWVLKLIKEKQGSTIAKTKGFTKIPLAVSINRVCPSFQLELPNGNRINFFESLTPHLYQIFL